ncbi:SRPBCC family protein [Geminicoccus roseus]|uniref:SRPBCC family protein n=1 Tax=Geminicoccus roseus TaxID=404900 RepID=UPI0003FA8DE4|nr:SRPBCC family protein [Geminicoccus roseus]
MNDYGTLIAPDTLRFERRLPGPIQRIWAYLTEPDKRARWLAGGPMELRQGGGVTLEFRHADLSATVDDGAAQAGRCDGTATVHGRVTRCDPPRLLAYTWGEDSGQDSEVTFELSEQDELVHLVLTHRRLRSASGRLSVAGGWHAHLAVLQDRLAGREPPPFWRTHQRLEAEYRDRLGSAASAA